MSEALFNFEGLWSSEINAFYGGIAQLVERLLCKQGVNGSSPFISTRLLVAVTMGKWFDAGLFIWAYSSAG